MQFSTRAVCNQTNSSKPDNLLNILFISQEAVCAVAMKVCLNKTAGTHLLTIHRSFTTAFNYLVTNNNLPHTIIMNTGLKTEAAGHFIQAVEKDERLQKIPLVILNDMPHSDEKEISTTLNVIGHYVLPVDYQELAWLIKEYTVLYS